MQDSLKVGSGSNGRFERDPRRQQELRMRPKADQIYKQVFGDDIEISRTEATDDATLDKEFAIDVTIKLPNGQKILGQEKFLSYKYAKYKSITVEHYQNPNTGEEGDWFRLAPQFYFVGYCTEDESWFSPWIVVDWLRVVLNSANGTITWQDNRNKDGSARASFRYTNMSALPSDCVIAYSWNGKDSR